MKKWKIGTISALLILTLGGTTVFAAGHGCHWSAADAASVPAGTCSWTGTCARDTDGDGVCGAWSGTCSDGDWDGICDNCGQAVHAYLDADGDGVCDHYGTWQSGNTGHHGGYGHGHGAHHQTF